MPSKMTTVAGQPSWRLANAEVELFVTRTGGHLAPVTFARGGAAIRPYAVAPWAEEDLPPDTPPIIRSLRGDFFCMPFGGNDEVWEGEDHQVHGATANLDWELVTHTADELHLRMESNVRPAVVDKRISLRPGHNAIYSQHQVSGGTGPIPIGHHACLKFPDVEGSGRLSSSRKIHRQVFVDPAEDPATGGYSCLQPGAIIDDLSACPTVFGTTADLTQFPLRRGFEDIFIQCDDPTLPFAWNAVSYPDLGYVWLSIKDPRVLSSTLYWWSNGGRHYAPWNGRHRNVLGMEEITAYFHYGLARSAAPNSLRKQGIPTTVELDPNEPLVVNYIMAACPTPAGFGRVTDIQQRDAETVTLVDENGTEVEMALALGFLTEGGK